MIDVLKEIKKYDEINIDKDSKIYKNELSEIMELLTKAWERLGKEQYKQNSKIDEILDILDEQVQDKQLYQDLRDRIRNKDEEQKILLKALLDLADSVEDIYRYAVRSGQKHWEEQMLLQWDKIGRQLAYIGIMRIDDTGKKFNLEFHIAKEVKNNSELEADLIIETLKSGYIYNGVVLRKSEVTVNNYPGERKE